ncbi:MAG: TIGR03032 family protein [Pseudomonadota bacterium]
MAKKKKAAEPAPEEASSNYANPVPRDAPPTGEIATNQSVTYSMSGGLVPWLANNNTALALSSYQSGKFYLIGRNPRGGLLVDERLFQHAMGIAVDGKRIHLATQNSLIEMASVLEGDQRANDLYDGCFVPRRINVIGAVDAHDVGIDKNGEPIFVVTKYNCLARLSPTHNFKPVWKPNFISKIVAEDRCHLNGLAMEDGEPAFVTAVSRSDTIDGWRDRRADGGVIIDVKTNEIVTDGLSMPHSPQVYQGQLYVLNSGTGELIKVDRKNGDKEVVCFCPGFTRGLAFHNGFAIIGLSRPRYKRFEGLELDQKLKDADSEPWTGIQIINLRDGSVAEWFRIDGAIMEVYDTAAVPGIQCGMSLSLGAGELASFVTIEDAEL